MGRPKGSKNKPKVDTSTPEIKIKNNNTTKTKIKPTISTPNGTKTVNDIKGTIGKYENLKEMFAATNDALQLIDLTKTESRTYTTYNRETLRTYLKSPFAYQSQLRNLSKYLYRICYDYRRICTHYARMICGNAFNIIPLIDITKDNDKNKILKKYYETLIRWQRMGFWNELVKLLIVAWREDTVYAYIYDDSDQEGGSCYFHILDGDYCKISSVEGGVPRFAFDFSFFRKNPTLLEYWDSEFQSKYNAYEKDSTLRWQELEPDRQICLKINSDDLTMDYPPFAALFEALISICDLQSLQSVKDELSAYKLLVARLKPLSGTEDPDDFEVDIKTALKYYNKLEASLPEYVNAVISPLPLEVVEFKDLNKTEDADMISSSMSNLFKKIGGVILDNDKTGTTVYESQIIEAAEMAHSTLVPQIEKWLNLYFNYVIGDDHAIIRYIDGVSPYTKKAKRKELLESAQNGQSSKLEIGILDGKTPLETLSLLYLENDILGLPEKMIPLSTSYTKTGEANGDTSTSGGAPTKEADELSDEGSETREKSKND